MGKKVDHLKVELAKTRVRRHLRKTESGVEDVMAHERLTVPEQHQLRIAKDTLKMNPAMRGVMGGPSEDEAKKIIARLEAKSSKKEKKTGYTPQSPETYEKRAAASTPKNVKSYEGVHPYKRKDNAALLRAQPSSQLKGGSTKAREDAAKEYRKKNPSPAKTPTAEQKARHPKWGGSGFRPKSSGGAGPPGEFLGHDANGSEIKVGSPVAVTGGPDKGARGTVVGTAKGGGIRVKVGTGVQAREMLVSPDELRVKSR